MESVGNYLMSALPFLLVLVIAGFGYLAVRADGGRRVDPQSEPSRLSHLERRVSMLQGRKPN